MVDTKECVPNPTTPEEITELYARLEDALVKQTDVSKSLLIIKIMTEEPWLNY